MAEEQESIPSDKRRIWWHPYTVALAGHARKDLGAALEVSGLDWNVRSRQVWTLDDDANLLQTEIASGHRAIVRDDTGEVLGFVSERYRPIQHRDAFAAVEELVDQSVAEINGAWQLRGGRKVVLAVLGQADIDLGYGDGLTAYMLFETAHDGTGGTRMLIAPFLPGSFAQLPMIYTAAVNSKAMHHGDPLDRGLAAGRVIQHFDTAMERLAQQLAKLSSTKHDDATCDHLIAAAVHSVGGRDSLRINDCQRISSILHNSTTVPDTLRRTRFGVLAAICEYATHGHPQRTIDGMHRSMTASRYSRIARNAMEQLA